MSESRQNAGDSASTMKPGSQFSLINCWDQSCWNITFFLSSNINSLSSTGSLTLTELLFRLLLFFMSNYVQAPTAELLDHLHFLHAACFGYCILYFCKRLVTCLQKEIRHLKNLVIWHTFPLDDILNTFPLDDILYEHRFR